MCEASFFTAGFRDCALCRARAYVHAAGRLPGRSTFLPGNRQEALMLPGFVFVVMGITLAQERKTERTLGMLRDLAAHRRW